MKCFYEWLRMYTVVSQNYILYYVIYILIKDLTRTTVDLVYVRGYLVKVECKLDGITSMKCLFSITPSSVY